MAFRGACQSGSTTKATLANGTSAGGIRLHTRNDLPPRTHAGHRLPTTSTTGLHGPSAGPPRFPSDLPTRRSAPRPLPHPRLPVHLTPGLLSPSPPASLPLLRLWRVSMDGRGRWMDNVFVERLWRTVKYEHLYLHDYATPRALEAGLSDYFLSYNVERIHSSLDYRTPMAVYLAT